MHCGRIREMTDLHPAYPTPEHEAATRTIVDHFTQSPVEAVLLVGSCARGKAVPGSCLDIAVLVSPEVPDEERAILEAEWEEFYASQPAFAAMGRHGPFAEVHLDIIDGQFEPGERNWTGGPDAFELEIGNILAYGVPLRQPGRYFQDLQSIWLPYYPEDLRERRLADVIRFCRNNLAHIPPYVERGLYFQAFDRLYNAFQEFLQALFIARSTYPIAYDKWIREQIVEILGLPELYQRLTGLFEISRFESEEIAERGREVERLLADYVEKGRP